MRTNKQNYVEYSVFTQRPAALSFPAYICGRWKSIKLVTMTFWGDTIAVPDKIALDTSPEECQIMKGSKRCDGEPMTFADGKWTHTNQPPLKTYWLQTVELTSIGCMLEEIKLVHDAGDEEVNTPLGHVEIAAGNYSHNHLTLIWNPEYATKLDHSTRMLESGFATMSNSSRKDVYLLEDSDKQLAYHVYPVQRCLVPDCVNRTDAYGIVGSRDLFITVKPAKNPRLTPPKISLTAKVFNKSSTTEAFNFKIQSRLQYIKDQLLFQENELARAIRSLQCDLRKTRHDQAASTAQYNGWLAASHLDLPKCTKLAARGNTVTAVKCLPTTVDFSTEVTKCGAQPRYNNYTINQDGWELVAYNPCYWTTGFVNFNGKPHVYQNNSWNEIYPKIIIPLAELSHSFRFEDINPFVFNPRNNPAYTDATHDHINIMADIAAAMNEHSPISLPGDPRQTHSTATLLITAAEKPSSTKTTFSSFWEKFKIFSFLGALTGGGLLLARYCYAFGCCGMLYSLLCKTLLSTTNISLELRRYRTARIPS